METIIRDELTAIKDQFSTPRLTTIDEAAGDFDDEDLIAREDMVVTVTHGGYIKRVPLSAYRAQRRGGKGRSGMSTRDEDFVTRLFVANTHTPVLFFSSAGQVYKLKVWRLPIAEPQGKGRALINMLPLDDGRAHHLDHAAARGRGRLAEARHHVRDPLGRGAPQLAGRLRRGQQERQDRHEARRGRRDRRRRDLLGRCTTCC